MEFEIVYVVLQGKNLTSTLQLFPMDAHRAQDFYYSFSKCSHELHSLNQPVQIFIVRTRHAPSTDVNHPYFLGVLNVRKKFHVEAVFLSRTATVYNTFPCGCFLELLNFGLFDLRSVVIYISYP